TFGRIDRVQRLFRSRTHRDVFGQVRPPHRAARINVKLSWTCDVRVLWPGPAMKQIVTANDCRVRIRKKRKGEAHFLRMPAIYNADAAVIRRYDLLHRGA